MLSLDTTFFSVCGLLCSCPCIRGGGGGFGFWIIPPSNEHIWHWWPGDVWRDVLRLFVTQPETVTEAWPKPETLSKIGWNDGNVCCKYQTVSPSERRWNCSRGLPNCLAKSAQFSVGKAVKKFPSVRTRKVRYCNWDKWLQSSSLRFLQT
jgi:hypothetical protein